MTIREQLKYNKENGRATLATNFYNYETLRAVLNAAKIAETSIILQLSESSIHYMGLTVAKEMAEEAIKDTGVQAWLHLDHGSDIDLVKSCIDGGFDSVMIDASEKPIEQNISITKDIVAYAKRKGTHVEAELGYVAKLGQEQTLTYTDPEEAQFFVQQTGVDALAVAVGSAHGFYKEPPKLQLDLIQQINDAVPASLVLHGSSGIPDDQIRVAVSNGIAKINLATELKDTFMRVLKNTLLNTDEIDLRKVFPKGTDAVTSLVLQKLNNMLQ